MKAALATLTLVLALGCNGKQPEPKADPKPAPAEPAEPKADPCVDKCLQENQARATDWEQIKRECEAQCRENVGEP